MELQGIFNVIKKCETEFKDREIPILGGVMYSQGETIKRIERYWSSEFFEDGSADSEALFFNIIKPAVRATEKNLDFDERDLTVKTVNGKDISYLQAKLVRLSIQQWLRENKLGKKLNKLKQNYVRYGSVIVEYVGGDEVFEIVEPNTLLNDQSVSSIKDSWVLQILYMTPNQLLEKKGTPGWDNDEIDDAVNNFTQNSKEDYVITYDGQASNNSGNDMYIKVYKFSGWVNKSDIEEEGDGLVYVRSYCVQPVGGKNKGKKEKGKLLYKKTYDKDQDWFRDKKFDAVFGRMLGVGVPEDMFSVQTIKNRQMNALIKAQELANLILFATDSEELVENVLTDLENGDISKFRGSLSRIDTSIRNISGYQLLNSEIQRIGNDLANMYEVVTGSSLPSGTPLGVANILEQNVGKYFEGKKEELGLFIEEIINDWVFPTIKKDIRSTHIIDQLNDEDLDILTSHIIKTRTFDYIKDAVLAGNPVDDKGLETVQEIIRNDLLKNGKYSIKVPASFYDSIIDNVRIVFTNEWLNKGTNTSQLMTLLQMLAQNPGLKQDNMFKRLADYAGYSVTDLAENEAVEQGAPPTKQMMTQLTKQQAEQSGNETNELVA